jgi:hypothetical protein
MYLLVIVEELWWMNQEWLELRWGRTIDEKWSQCLGRLVRYQTVTVIVTLALGGSEWLASRPGRFTPEKITQVHTVLMFSVWNLWPLGFLWCLLGIAVWPQGCYRRSWYQTVMHISACYLPSSGLSTRMYRACDSCNSTVCMLLFRSVRRVMYSRMKSVSYNGNFGFIAKGSYFKSEVELRVTWNQGRPASLLTRGLKHQTVKLLFSFAFSFVPCWSRNWQDISIYGCMLIACMIWRSERPQVVMIMPMGWEYVSELRPPTSL